MTPTLALAALLALLAGPSGAANSPEGARAPSSTTASTPRAKEPRYCITFTVTESRIPRRTCKTRAQWEDEGVELPPAR